MSTCVDKPAILLIGGTGKVSKRITRLLSNTETPPIIILASRSGTSPSGLSNVRGIQFDWNDAATYHRPFSSPESPIKSLFLIAPPFLDVLPPTKQFLSIAMNHGLERVVFLSGSILHCGDGPLLTQISNHIKETGLEYTIIRSTWFMENFSEMTHHRNTIRDDNFIVSATEHGKIPWISADDIAEVATMALIDGSGKFTRRELLLLGPQYLSYDEVAGLIGRKVERKIRHEKVSEGEIAEGMVEGGMEKRFAILLAELDGAIRRGEEMISEEGEDDLKNVIGREGKTFQQYLEGIAADTW